MFSFFLLTTQIDLNFFYLLFGSQRDFFQFFFSTISTIILFQIVRFSSQFHFIYFLLHNKFSNFPQNCTIRDSKWEFSNKFFLFEILGNFRKNLNEFSDFPLLSQRFTRKNSRQKFYRTYSPIKTQNYQ